MFSITYQIVNLYDEVPIGKDGYIRIDCDGNHYGEIFSPELDGIMDISSIYNWVEGLMTVAEILHQHELQYVFLSDNESYNAWIQFIRQSDIIEISLIFDDKTLCEHSMIEIDNCSRGQEIWKSRIDAKEFYREVDKVSKHYICDLNCWPENTQYVQRLKTKALSFDI